MDNESNGERYSTGTDLDKISRVHVRNGATRSGLRTLNLISILNHNAPNNDAQCIHVAHSPPRKRHANSTHRLIFDRVRAALGVITSSATRSRALTALSASPEVLQATQRDEDSSVRQAARTNAARQNR